MLATSQTSRVNFSPDAFAAVEGGWWAVHRTNGVWTAFRERDEAIELRNRLGFGVITWGEELPGV